MDDNHNKISDELLAAFLDGNVNADETERLLSALGSDKELAEIVALADAIDVETQKEERQIIPMWALAAANPDNLCSFECEAFILRHLDYDIDHWTLLETAKANNWVREEGTPLHHVGRLLELKGLYVERKYDATSEDLEKAIDGFKEVIAIVDRNIPDGYEDCRHPCFHAVYVTRVEDDGAVVYLNLDTMFEETLERDDFLKAWKCSGCYMVSATKSLKGYNPQPIDVEAISLDANLEDLTEAIAENAHDIWARARMDEGWTYGPVRDDVKKQHPDLVPYAQLSDSEKEYDRLMAMNTLRLVNRLGYDIVNNNKNRQVSDKSQ